MVRVAVDESKPQGSDGTDLASGNLVSSPEHITLRDGFILGSYGDEGEYAEKRVFLGEGSLQEFATLWQEGDDSILDFARHNGVLGVFVKNLEAMHDSYQEPCKGWRQYSRQAQAIINIAARLRRDEQGAQDDWTVLREHTTDVGDLQPESELDWQRLKLAHVLNHWLKIGLVRPHVVWDAEARAWQITMMRESSLAGCFGALALMLAKRAAGADSIPICSYCGTAYVPKRKPKSGASNYCPGCRNAGVPVKQAKRFSRANKGNRER